MTAPIIQTPRGTVVINENGKAELKFNTHFRNRWQRNYSDAQKFMDSEVLRDCEPYIPLQTGMLVMSGILGTDVGSGLVQWIAPYARAQYYRPGKPGSKTGRKRGPQWFERSKAVNKDHWVRGSKRIAGKE